MAGPWNSSRPVRDRDAAYECLPEAPPPRLEDLITSVAAGDQNAFEALYHRVSGPVYSRALQVLRDPMQAEEVTQEVLLYLWREAGRYDETRGAAIAWVLTLAHRRAVDRVRSEQCARERHHWLALRDVEIAYDSVAEEVEARLDREAVRGCLVALTELQRETVALAYYAGHTYREVAEHLDVPLNTVKTRMRDGFARMRVCFVAMS